MSPGSTGLAHAMPAFVLAPLALAWVLAQPQELVAQPQEPVAQPALAPSPPALSVPSEPPQPWVLDPAELGSQRLFRLRYDGPEGEGSFRITLRLAAPDHYGATAVDAVGRAVWSLAVEPGGCLWLDHRQRRFCRFAGPRAPALLEIAPFTLSSLPALLLGRMPVVPAGPVESHPPHLSFLDSEKRRWSATLDEAGQPLGWTFWQDGEPVAWWGRYGTESVLSERRRGYIGRRVRCSAGHERDGAVELVEVDELGVARAGHGL
ncbi:MAG TPA: hypothetical protein PK413_17395, partial [Thermoanaerobaculia bacterium]|nr:hypothetical protein [Thermoanaerobaculia bacterium]